MSRTIVAPTDDELAWIDDALARFAATRDTPDRDERLRDDIVRRADWIAVRSARRFADRGEPFDDLLQVARIGLLKAVDRFDPGQGVPFGAFASPTIVGELRRWFRDHTWGMHVGRRAKELRPAVNAARDELSASLGRSPTVPEIAQHLEVGEDAVLEALEANEAYRPQSLDLPAVRHPSQEGGFDLSLDREVLRHALERLKPRERTIIKLRFVDEMSQSQIAEHVGTSQVHVGRLLTASLVELRRVLEEGDENDPDDGHSA